MTIIFKKDRNYLKKKEKNNRCTYRKKIKERKTMNTPGKKKEEKRKKEKESKEKNMTEISKEEK